MKDFSPVRYSLIVQIAVSVPCSFLAALFTYKFGYEQAWLTMSSFMTGSVIFIVANMYFTHYAFRFKFRSKSEASSVVDNEYLGDWIQRSFMWGHMGKLTLTIVGFAMVLRFVDPIEYRALFAGYIVMIFTQWWLGKKLAAIVAV